MCPEDQLQINVPGCYIFAALDVFQIHNTKQKCCIAVNNEMYHISQMAPKTLKSSANRGMLFQLSVHIETLAGLGL